MVRSKLRVAAVDSTPLFCEGLRNVIEHTPGLAWLGAVDSPQVIRAALAKVQPHVVLVDSMVDPCGALIRDLVAANPAPTVVAMVDKKHRTAMYLAVARAAGAHGFVCHDATPPRLVTTIRQAHANGYVIDPDLAPADDARSRFEVDAAKLLTSRQREVLYMIAHGMTEGAIAARLVVSRDTVRSHVKHLRERLGARDRAQAVARGYHLGVLPMVTAELPA